MIWELIEDTIAYKLIDESLINLHPSIIKSVSDVILKLTISGVAINTLGLPPCSGIFASKSPNDLDTYIYLIVK